MEGAALWVAALSEWGACGLFAAAAATDLRNRTVPNAIPLLLLALFAVHAGAGPTGPAGSPWAHAAVGIVLLGLGFALWCTGKFGAGDAKLAAVAGLWVGTADLSLFLLGLGLCALLLGAAALLPLDRARRMRPDLPFAVAISPPALFVLVPRALSQDIPWSLP